MNKRVQCKRTKGYCNKCGLPIDLCVCKEIEKEEQRIKLRRKSK